MAEAIISRRGGGGGGLNFQVVGDTTAPSNPKENTIWVNTSTNITSWVFSATQPTAATGKVWIYTGTSSTIEFNALKKNGIQVYPISAKQYVSGAWVDKTAKSWQNGAWVEWFKGTYLFKDGNTYEDITGGWAAPSGWTPGTINDAGNLYMAGPSRMCGTYNAINKGDHSKLVINIVSVKQNASSKGATIMLTSARYSTAGTGLVGVINPTAPGPVTIPLSGVDIPFYIVTYAYNSGEILEISDVWME